MHAIAGLYRRAVQQVGCETCYCRVVDSVWMHSGGPIQFLGDAVLMARAGVVSLLVGQAEGTPGGTPEQARDQLITDVIGLRRAADLLETRADVDRSAGMLLPFPSYFNPPGTIRACLIRMRKISSMQPRGPRNLSGMTMATISTTSPP